MHDLRSTILEHGGVSLFISFNASVELDLWHAKRRAYSVAEIPITVTVNPFLPGIAFPLNFEL